MVGSAVDDDEDDMSLAPRSRSSKSYNDGGSDDGRSGDSDFEMSGGESDDEIMVKETEAGERKEAC